MLQEALDVMVPQANVRFVQRFYTIQETAEVLKVSADTVRRMVKRGQLRCVVITERTRRVSFEAINELAQKGVNNETTWQ